MNKREIGLVEECLTKPLDTEQEERTLSRVLDINLEDFNELKAVIANCGCYSNYRCAAVGRMMELTGEKNRAFFVKLSKASREVDVEVRLVTAEWLASFNPVRHGQRFMKALQKRLLNDPSERIRWFGSFGGWGGDTFED